MSVVLQCMSWVSSSPLTLVLMDSGWKNVKIKPSEYIEILIFFCMSLPNEKPKRHEEKRILGTVVDITAKSYICYIRHWCYHLKSCHELMIKFLQFASSTGTSSRPS